MPDDKRQENDTQANQRPDPTPLLSRRAFLARLLAAGGAGLLAACAPGRVPDQPFAGPYNTATPARVLASPQAPQATSEAQDAAPQAEGDLSLQQFLVLSAVLTGVDNLNPAEGRIYLQSLQASDEFDVTLAELFQQAANVLEGSAASGNAPTATIEDLEAQGIFESEATTTLADAIIEHWYTGIYTTSDGEQAVATYVDALAWKALSFTKPNSICGSPGFWEERPQVIS